MFKEKIAIPCKVGSKAWCFIVAKYVFSSSASAELFLKQNRMSSYFQLLFINKGMF